MEGISVVDLEGRTYKCKFCKTPLVLADELVSKAFHCCNGKAYLFKNAANIKVGTAEERMMFTGMQTVTAHEQSQKYKEGKFVLDRGMIVDGDESEFNIDTHPTRSAEEEK
ncbi:Hypothetical predicted protein [Olea europaea subsp. europaea]|uniref:Yippee domain-containing protein n=1 Tax=Olea europaea subsp. europaea TaxID=158383 RepID=A0A8S0RQR2_OLEEU|nr:Hypothetical predicted protein [Olea europaea subsp. europaea]